MATVDVGDVHPLAVEVRDGTGALANAGAVALTITLPDGATTTPTVSNPSTGRYEADHPAAAPGRHLVRWVATGVNACAYSEAFDVRPADPAYLISPSDARQALTTTDAAAAALAAHDDELRLYVEAATGAVERHLGQVLLRRTVTEYHRLPSLRRQLALHQGPVTSVTSVGTVDGARTWDLAGLHLDPATGTVTVTAGPGLFGHLQVVYVAGHTVVPATHVLAVRITLQHLWSTQRGGRGAPRPGGMGTMVVPAGYSLPNAAKDLLPEPMSGIA